jgi:ubiquinone/menaquinone biosynthesis C-methylase UbiE
MTPKIFNRFLTLFFRLLYHQFAWAYDFVAAVVSLGRWNSWIKAILPYIDSERILELGSGTGVLLSALGSRSCFYIGVDESAQMLQHAQRRVLRTNSRSIHLIRGCGESIPVQSHYYGVVVATFPTEYIYSSRTIHEIRRVLQPGGKAVILISAQLGGDRVVERVLRKIFAITRQSPGSDMDLEIFRRPYAEAGFDAKLEWATTLGMDHLLLLIAKSS